MRGPSPVLCTEVRKVVVRQPEEELVAIKVLDQERRPSPLHASRLDAIVDDMPAKLLALIVLESDEDSTVAGARARIVADFIEDQLETKEADLKHALVEVPIQREAE